MGITVLRSNADTWNEAKLADRDVILAMHQSSLSKLRINTATNDVISGLSMAVDSVSSIGRSTLGAKTMARFLTTI